MPRSTTATRAGRCSTSPGKVVGVNAQIESDSGDNAGVGFAIPSNTVKTVVAQIVSGGQVEHAYLGVSIGDAAGAGAAVEQVQGGSPAAKAGLAKGDVVTAVDGHSVADAASLDRRRRRTCPRRPRDVELHAQRIRAHAERHARHASQLVLSNLHEPGAARQPARRRRVSDGEELLEPLGVLERPDQREPQRVRADDLLRDALHVGRRDGVDRREHFVRLDRLRPRAPRA